MKIILFLLCLINYAHSACVPGSVPCENAGIENFKVQTVDPTFTASPGEKGLFNTNSQFKTKDEFGNIQRLVTNENILSLVNGDVEEGLTGFAGIGTVNILTPLKGLKSLNLDTTALNDFAETTLATIPRNLMGQVCMARVDIKGGDANLQLQVVNGAGTIVGMKQMAVFADSNPQFITFNCPTQALITATPALGQLKIKITQSTATNAALATLDSFYLGEFVSNTMNVQGQSQWYYYTANADINGNFAFPAPTASTNDKTLFTYAGTTLTALKPTSISLGAYGKTTGSLNAVSDTSAYCTIAGIERKLSFAYSFVSGQTQIWSTPANAAVPLSVGDTCRINFARTGATITEYGINITATPLPQLATIVNTNTPRAGLLGSRIWVPNAGCQWSRGAGWGPFGAIAACATTAPTNQGFVVNDATLNGQLPQITLSKYPKGYHYITINAQLGTAGTGNASYRISDGINSSSLGQIAGASFSIPSMTFVLYNPTDRVNAVLSVEGNSVSIAPQIFSLDANRFLTISDFYQPDLSDPYSIPELYAALPPQVINSSGKIWRTESCYITNNGTAAMASSSCNTWISSVSRTALGRVVINIPTTTFSGNYECLGNNNINGGIPSIQNKIGTVNTPPEPTGFMFASVDSNGVAGDWSFTVNCQGFTN